MSKITLVTAEDMCKGVYVDEALILDQHQIDTDMLLSRLAEGSVTVDSYDEFEIDFPVTNGSIYAKMPDTLTEARALEIQ